MLYDEKYANKEKKVPLEYIYNELHDDFIYNLREKNNYFRSIKNSKWAKLITDFAFLFQTLGELSDFMI